MIFRVAENNKLQAPGTKFQTSSSLEHEEDLKFLSFDFNLSGVWILELGILTYEV